MRQLFGLILVLNASNELDFIQQPDAILSPVTDLLELMTNFAIDYCTKTYGSYTGIACLYQPHMYKFCFIKDLLQQLLIHFSKRLDLLIPAAEYEESKFFKLQLRKVLEI